MKDETLLQSYMYQILEAARSLHELHPIGVAHRDLSLENFLVAEDVSLRLTDFAQAPWAHSWGDGRGPRSKQLYLIELLRQFTNEWQRLVYILFFIYESCKKRHTYTRIN